MLRPLQGLNQVAPRSGKILSQTSSGIRAKSAEWYAAATAMRSAPFRSTTMADRRLKISWPPAGTTEFLRSWQRGKFWRSLAVQLIARN